MKTLIIALSLNERDNIDWLIERWQAMAAGRDDLNLLLADDDSLDGTWRRYGTAAGSDARMHLLRRTGRFKGRGSATLESFRWALDSEHGYDRVVEMAANRSDDPAHVPALLARLDAGADVVVACRTPRTPRGLARWATGANVADPDSGFRAWTRPALERLGIADLKAPGWDFPQKSLARAARRGLKIDSIEVPWADPHGGTRANRGKEPGALAMLALGVRRVAGLV